MPEPVTQEMNEQKAAPARRSNGRPVRLVSPVAGAVLEFFFRITYCFLQIFLRFFVIVRRAGPHLPPGPVIVAPNHCSFMDPVGMQMSCWRHLSFMMTEVYYKPLWSRWFFQMWRTIPVKEGRVNREALSVAIDALQRGWAVCIFPEGAIAKDGRLQKFQPGVAALAEATGAPVVPVDIHGTFEAFPRHAKFPKLLKTVVVRYGAPIPAPVPGGDDASRREQLRAFSDQLRQKVVELQMQREESKQVDK